MAEERLIDTDKDKKYKIRKNADGEDELIIDGAAETEEDEVSFEVTEQDTDDEEAAVLTPEQLAARERMRQEELAAREKLVNTLIASAREKLAAPDYEGALYDLSRAAEADPENGEVWALKLRTLSRGFTDYTALEECGEAAENVEKYSTEEQKKELEEISSPIKARLSELESKLSALSEENENKKAERREIFLDYRKGCLKFFTFSVIPFALFLALGIAFACIYFANDGAANLALFIAFSALAFIALIVTLFAVRKLWAAQYKVIANEKNSATKLGREVDKLTSDAAVLRAIINAFTAKNDDIS